MEIGDYWFNNKYLFDLAGIIHFAKNYAFNQACELTPAEYIADQFLRRSIDLAEEFESIVEKGHYLNASILQRAISERAAILRYLHEHDQFDEFQKYSMACEYQTLQHVTSDKQIPHVFRQSVEQRKAQIRQEMGHEPSNPRKYWKAPTYRESLYGDEKGRPNETFAHVSSYEIPSSSLHVRHNDAEPTGLAPELMVYQVTSFLSALTSTALRIAGNEDTLHELGSFLAKIRPDSVTIEPL